MLGNIKEVCRRLKKKKCWGLKKTQKSKKILKNIKGKDRKIWNQVEDRFKNIKKKKKRKEIKKN